MAALGAVPSRGGVLCSIANSDKAEALPIISQLSALGFEIFATAGTAAALANAGISATAVGRIGQSRPNVLDIIEEGRVALVLNSVSNVETDESRADLRRRHRRRGGADGQGWLPHPARRRSPPHRLLHLGGHRRRPGRRHGPAAPRRRRHRGHCPCLPRGNGRGRPRAGEVIAR